MSAKSTGNMINVDAGERLWPLRGKRHQESMGMNNLPLSADLIAEANARALPALEDDYFALARKLERAYIAIDAVKDRVAAFAVAIPTWGVGRGGTRFARFPMPGEPTSIHEKLEDCAVINQLCRITLGASASVLSVGQG